jgi:hypothetical protein
VFMNVFNQLLPQINTLLILMHPFWKNNKVHLRLHHIRHRQSVLPFVIQEMNNNPEFVMKFLKQDRDLTRAYSPKLKGNKVGIIKPINPQLLIDVFSWPFSHLQRKC